ncbi:DUF2059 domain-containing protein [Mesobacterium sp. TK19101]|uniref:DUF2059 domain-containing protein n=1 Tax=Mesobacterium hydrothermale TaxID=3111907 RepID=A0ABU6HDE1_9RHOB|nr:DUF2059 domain-containing protein [Mesobacterium sp. TK19101]MEC3860474.1 DUF2059 domain-containing protein [Mesobacterium sp. TK19101]
MILNRALALATGIALSLFALPAAANQARDLMNALGLPQIIEVMRDEGLAYGKELSDTMLPGGGDSTWPDTVSRIYDKQTMTEEVESLFVETLGDTDLDPLLTFFNTPGGKRLVQLEISARRAMLDKGVEDGAREAFRRLDGTADARLALVSAFVEVNDLLESNVVGALNASYQFYRGMVEGGALEMGEADILTDVWAQEPETRADTREWLFGFLLMAYGPVSEETLADYIALSSTEEGRAMNRALFAAFNQMYDDISYGLGLAVARQLQGQDL